MSEPKAATAHATSNGHRAADITTMRMRGLRAVLDECPTAVVAAIDDDGLFVEMPDSMVIDGHRVAHARSALDLVQPTDRRAVIDAWMTVKEQGRSQASVTLAGTPSAVATLHLFDLTAEHGVFMGVIAATGASEHQMEDVAEIAPPPPRIAYTRKNEVATIIHADAAVTEMLGWAQDEMVGQSALGFVHPDDAERAIDLWMECLSRPGATCRTRLRHKRRDGSWLWLELSNTNLLADPDAGYVDCEMFDISQEMEAHEAVRASQQLLSRLTASLPVGVLQFDTDGMVIYANDRIYEIVGVEPGTDETALQSSVVDPAELQRAMLAIHHGHDIDMQIVIQRADDGARRECTLTIRSLTNDDGELIGGVLVLDDVTEQARMRSELEHRATYDELTSCVNRRTVLGRLSEALTTARIATPGAGTAAIFVDLDDFKDINDRHGHATGDVVLASVAARLQRVVRAQDVVGRIGGDEFLVVCPDVADQDAAIAMAERISAAMEAPMTVNGASLHQTASIGVAWTGARPAVDADALIAEADQAMYAAKRDGKRSIVLSLS